MRDAKKGRRMRTLGLVRSLDASRRRLVNNIMIMR